MKAAIPPYAGDPANSWISSAQLPKVPRQDLLPTEARPFLKYMFSGIASRPKSIGLREGAAVARYLKTLARETEAAEERVLLERLAERICETVLQYARFPVSNRVEVLRFLKTHGATYLAGFDIAMAMELILSAKEPRHYGTAPHLLSVQLSAQGRGTPQRADDLTERIWVAYQALRMAKVKNARRMVAAALNQHGLETQARGATLRTWGPEEVGERLKQFETRGRRRSRNSEEWENSRKAIVYKWVYLFRGFPKPVTKDASARR